MRIVTDMEMLKMYIPLVDFIADVFGESTCVYLKSAKPRVITLHVRNNFNKQDSKIPELYMRYNESKNYIKNDNYHTGVFTYFQSKKVLHSVYHIKKGERTIGFFSICRDISAASDLVEMLSKAIEYYKIGNFSIEQHEIDENGANSDIDLSHRLINKGIEEAIADFNVPLERLSYKEKIMLVKALNIKGFFAVRGSVRETAKKLGISVPTLYRYLKSNFDDKNVFVNGEEKEGK